jgi:regulator of protease activity HflC (stomatin/prohibitin superfamily)
MDVNLETKTKDNVFVKVFITISYKIDGDRVYDAVYKASNTSSIMKSTTLDEACSTLPTMNLDGCFEQKQTIADSVQNALEKKMSTYGISIIRSTCN